MSKLHRTYRWQKLRAGILKRDPLCVNCGRPASEVDHRKPASQGGDFWDQRNLQPLCRVCHERKTAAENRGPLPTVCVHGWPSDLDEACPDCPPPKPESRARPRRRGRKRQ